MKLNNNNNTESKGKFDNLEEDVTKGQAKGSGDVIEDKMTAQESKDSEQADGSDSDNLNFEGEIEELKQKYGELNDSYLRLHAEYDNFRKRTLKEKTELIKSGGERVLLDVITVVDDFERALDSLNKTDEKDALIEGMNLIYVKFVNFLKQHGVSEIETIGQPFDADRFEAVTTIPANDESQKGMVVDCIQKGYEMNQKIIRYPKVIVGE